MYEINLTAAATHFTIFYFSLIILSGLMGAFRVMRESKKVKYIILVSLILFVPMAFRDHGMGNDTNSYISIFNTLSLFSNPFDYIGRSNREAGYLLFCWLLTRLHDDPRILFVITAVFIIFSLGRFAKKYVKNVGLFYCLFVGTLLFDFFISGLRSALSIAIFLFAVDFLIERKPGPYFAICVLAMLFHNSAFVYFFVYPLLSPRFRENKSGTISNFLLIVAAFFAGYFFEFLLPYFFRLFPKYMNYLGTVRMDGEVRLAVVLKIFVCALLIFVPKVLRKAPTQTLELDNLGKRMSLLNLLIMIVAMNATVGMRFTSLFQPFTMMQYSNEIGRVHRDGNNRTWIILFTLAAFYVYGLVIVVLKTPEWQTTYPFQLSMWINIS